MRQSPPLEPESRGARRKSALMTCCDMRIRNTLLVAAFAIGSMPAAAIIKCVAPDGSITIQDTHCPPGSKSASTLPPQPKSDPQRTSRLAPIQASPQVSGLSTSIREKCAKDWPDDFRMRQFCEQQQSEAALNLRRPLTSAGKDEALIRRKCEKDWPDDYRMRVFCQEQQTKALATLNRPLNVGSSEANIIRTKCLRDWPEDFKMRAYCEDRQVEALGKLLRK